MRSTARLTQTLRSRTVLTVAGAAAALVGAGTATATAATVATPVHRPQAAAAVTAPVRTLSGAAALAAGPDARATLTSALMSAPQAATGLAAPHHAAAPAAPAAPAAGQAGKSRHAGSAGVDRGSAKPAAPARRPAESWSQIEQAIAKQIGSREPTAADQLQPVSPDGTQAWMPINGDQLANATTIVKQALAKKMGLRSAVIAVATSMQEAQLQNIDYGTSDSLGLFQQQPDCGWGTAHQVMNPAYAAGAFLSALQRYQGTNPAWAHQPLWQAAQGVQHSAFPFAYAKWETQAAHLVKQIVTQVK